MPEYVQEDMVHSLKGLENAKILRYAYAIEYDAIDSKQIKRSLETKLIEGLYTAGQINGTSGTWIKASTAGASVTATGLNHNDKVYTRLTDGTNNTSIVSRTITKIDKTLKNLDK